MLISSEICKSIQSEKMASMAGMMILYMSTTFHSEAALQQKTISLYHKLRLLIII